MKKVLILGASAPIAKFVSSFLDENKDIEQVLLMRNERKIYDKDRTIIGDATNAADLVSAMHGVDLVFSALGPFHMEKLAKTVVAAMEEANIKRLIWTASLGIYNESAFSEAGVRELGKPEVPNTYLWDQKNGADVIEHSNLDYTIIRPNWLTNNDIVEDIALQHRNEKTESHFISRKSVGKFVADLIQNSDQYIKDSVAISAKN
ncbi:NAD(P)H-binding protein [Chryseobacterium oryzae]|uniref:NAD(P)H-binding protein n=1 Tax=Chryseobacterium oryzae TaxID=2929799 RepID=A0ABY4BEH5_9FLAO|nr:NAD(P)H-binding protein [Chryseobacterium oryzae]UOE37551.1 NAD(P)H-binding protein [Chryseobacterium oryzae]